MHFQHPDKMFVTKHYGATLCVCISKYSDTVKCIGSYPYQNALIMTAGYRCEKKLPKLLNSQNTTTNYIFLL